MSLYTCYLSCMEKGLVVHSATLLKTVGKLSTMELKLMLYCITKVRRDAGYEPENRHFEIHHADFSGAIKKENCYIAMKSAAKRLHQRIVVFNEPVTDKDGKVWDGEAVSVLTSHKWREGDGTIKLSFSEEFMPLLANLSGKFAKYLFEDVAALESHYAIILYGLLRNHFNTQKSQGKKENLIIEMEDLRTFFELKGKYKAHKDFKKRVLDKAADEINRLSPLSVEYEQLKSGRRIVAYSFKVTSKHDEAAKPLPKRSKARKKIDLEMERVRQAFNLGKKVTFEGKELLELNGNIGSFEDGAANIYLMIKKGIEPKIKQA